MRIEQLPSGCTTGDLAKRLNDGRSSEGSHLRMLVRAQIPGRVETCLPSSCHCDRGVLYLMKST